MENVPRVFDFDVLADRMAYAETNYRTWKGVLNAAMYGLPQTRQRAIVIGYRADLGLLPSPPPPTHFGKREVFDYTAKRLRRPSVKNAVSVLGTYAELLQKQESPSESLDALSNLIVVREALSDLPPAGDDDEPLPYCGKPSDYALTLRNGEVHNHRGWRHGPELLKRLRKVKPGEGLLDHHGRALSRPYFSQAYARLHPQGLARTITTNFHNPGSGRFLHYRDLRTITVREAARLQGIPDSFVFLGNPSTQERLVGNAFPIPLAEALARKIGADLEDIDC
jgi:DNA (cytosine-5)-methyltransferase 1